MMLRIESLAMSANPGDYVTYGRMWSQWNGNIGINNGGPNGRRQIYNIDGNTVDWRNFQWGLIGAGGFSTLGYSKRIYIANGCSMAVYFVDMTNGVTQFTVNFNGNNGTITVSNGSGTLISTNAWQFTPNAWFWCEIMGTISTALGVVKIWIGNNLVINLSGVKTQTSSRSAVDTTGVNFNGYGACLDFHWWDNTGSYNNTALGDRQVLGFLPKANGDSTDYTPHGLASNYLNAANSPPNLSDYNSSATVGAQDLYTGASQSGVAAVGAVQSSLIGALGGTGVRSQAAIIKSGSTIGAGAGMGLSISARAQFGLWETDPSTGVPFVPSALTALQWGGEVTA